MPEVFRRFEFEVSNQAERIFLVTVLSRFFSQVEVDEMIRKSMNLLLTRTFSGCLSSTFRSPHINLQEIIQIIVDTGYLEEATVYMEEFISNITG